MSVSTLLWALIGGAVIGLLGKALAPGGRRDIALWLTVLIGIGGVLIGNWFYIKVLGFQAQTDGLDWWRHIWQVGVAAILVVIITGTAGRKRS